MLTYVHQIIIELPNISLLIRKIQEFKPHGAAVKNVLARQTRLFSPEFEPIVIPYEGTTVPGYFYRAPEVRGDNEKGKDNGNGANASRPRPTLIVHGGFDSTLEEIYTSSTCIRTRLQLLDYEIKRCYNGPLYAGCKVGLSINLFTIV